MSVSSSKVFNFSFKTIFFAGKETRMVAEKFTKKSVSREFAQLFIQRKKYEFSPVIVRLVHPGLSLLDQFDQLDFAYCAK